MSPRHRCVPCVLSVAAAFWRKAPPLLLLVLASCSGGDSQSRPTQPPVTPPPTPIAAIVLSSGNVELIVGQSMTLAAETRSAAGATLNGRTVTWVSANPAVVTVSGGLVTAVSTGTTTVTATAEGQSATAQIAVRPVPVYRVVASPSSLALVVQQTVQVTVQVLDSLDRVLNNRPVVWSSSATSVASVSSGLVTAVAPGTAIITANVEGVSSSTTVSVTAIPVARIELSRDSLALEVGAVQSVGAVPMAANGSVLPGRVITWSSSAPAIATVNDGLVTALGAGTTTITAASEGIEARVRVTVAWPPVAPHAAAGDGHSCAVVASGAAYCWGENGAGELGFETGGNMQLTARAVVGNLRFSLVGAGNGGSCGLTVDRRVYCWGENGAGYLGDGSPSATRRAAPGPIASSQQFTGLSVSRAHRCAVTESGEVYCWGFNAFSQLGNGTTATAFTPQRVQALPAVTAVSAGEDFTCALDRDQGVWCWGRNNFGQLGDGTTINRPLPVRLPGVRRYMAVSTGIRMSCALDDTGMAWCWGRGPVGDGTASNRATPTSVVTDQRFTQIASGASHTCALASDGKAWCWGGLGAIGDGAMTSRAAPVPVTGDRRYTAIAAGYDVTCAAASDGVYCWGTNSVGELGNGTRDRQLVPVRVLGLPAFVP